VHGLQRPFHAASGGRLFQFSQFLTEQGTKKRENCLHTEGTQKQCEALLEKEICVLCLLLLLLLSGKSCLVRTNPLWLMDECFIFPIFFFAGTVIAEEGAD
jgi:hypothetical protein